MPTEEPGRSGACPDCGSREWIEGPHGGLSVNVYCAQAGCHSGFNVMGPLGIERITEPAPGTLPPFVNGRRGSLEDVLKEI